MCLVTILQGRDTRRVNCMTKLMTSKRPKSNRNIIWSISGQTYRFDGFFSELCSDGSCIHGRKLALIRTKAKCGVALDMFNILVTFTNGQIDVSDTHIILEIHKLLCHWLIGTIPIWLHGIARLQALTYRDGILIAYRLLNFLAGKPTKLKRIFNCLI